MAAKNRKRKISFKFELGLSGLLGLGIVCFCVFLWMFLFGIWAGQTVLQSEGGFDFSPDNIEAATDYLKNSGNTEVVAKDNDRGIPSGEDAGIKGLEDKGSSFSEPEVSYFCLQIGAFRDKNRALNTVLSWRAKGYDAFMQTPDFEAGDQFWRVFIGKYEKLAEANKYAAQVEEVEEIKAFIALIPESRLQGPLVDNTL